MSKHRDKIRLPDHIAEAVLAGNLDYPQTGSGIALYGGRAAIDMIVAGNVTWPQVMFSRPTGPQVNSVIKAVGKAHRAFDIKYRHEDDPSAHKHMFNTQRLAVLTMSFLAPFARAVTGFSTGMLPGLETVPDDVPIYMTQENTPDVGIMKKRQMAALDALFGCEKTAVVRPEVIALQGIFAAAHEAMNPKKNPTARDIVKERLPHIRMQHITGKHSHEYKQASSVLHSQDLAISTMVTHAVYNALPEIQDNTSLWVPGAVVDGFLTCYMGNVIPASTGSPA